MPRTEAGERSCAAASLLAPAKINLALHVTDRRPDGYHSIETLAVFTRFGDRLSVTQASTDCFTVTGPFASGVPLDQTNLVLRARDHFRRGFAGKADEPAAIELEKNLPLASGIGGGSSDAAATLRLLARFRDLGADEGLLDDIARKLGADVPMCLAARPLIARGIGENIERITGFPALPLVLVNPGVRVGTPEVFRALAKRDNPPMPALPGDRTVARLISWLRTTRNDLQAAAIEIAPVIGSVITTLMESGALFARMSGSGATCFGLFASEAAAEAAAGAIRAENPGWFVVATTSTAS